MPSTRGTYRSLRSSWTRKVWSTGWKKFIFGQKWTDWLKKQPNVKDAMATRGLQIHAFVYDKEKTRCLRLVDTVDGAVRET